MTKSLGESLDDLISCHELTVLSCALGNAACHYDDLSLHAAGVYAFDEPAARPSAAFVMTQFQRQAADARALLLRIEQ